MEIKYLSNGKKVSVVGKINKSEYIVQEIFVTKEGSEIPSGENFTATSLHDEPVESWLARETAKIKTIKEKLEKERDELNTQIRNLKQQRQGHADIVKTNLKLIELLPEYDWTHFCDMLVGNVKWVCCNDGWEWYQPSLFDKEVFYWDGWGYDRNTYKGLKLISVMGESNGKLSYNIHCYPSGEGFSKINVTFFKTDQELVEWLTNKMEEKHKEGKITMEIIAALEKHITVPKKIKDSIMKKEKAAIEEKYKEAQEKVKQEYKEKLKNFGKYEN